MIRKKRTFEPLEKLNIVPIMDAVFIFIFFLLFSAQFIKLYQIEMDAPVVSEISKKMKLKKEPLNLRVKIEKEKISIEKGIDGELYETYYKADKGYLNDLKNDVLSLRLKYPDDDFVIISPLPLIQYKEIIKVIDTVQSLPKGKVHKILKGEKKIRLKKIFSQVVLETVDEN